MSDQQTTDAWAENQKIRKDFTGFYQIAGGFVVVIIGVIIGAVLFHNDEEYWGNIWIAALGIGFAVFVLDQRAEQRRLRDWQERLLLELGSKSSETAARAVYELGRRGWLKGDSGVLKGADLTRAVLSGADLGYANLQGTKLKNAKLRYANLTHANLQRADLVGAGMSIARLAWANLQGAFMSGANLKGASLSRADLQRVRLENADLQDANLEGADLRGARLSNANLQKVNLSNAKFDESSILPDGKKWTPDTDMSRFTNPNHAQFWRWDDGEDDAFNFDE